MLDSDHSVKQDIRAQLTTELRGMLERHSASGPAHACAPGIAGQPPRARNPLRACVACEANADCAFTHTVRSILVHLLSNIEAAGSADAEGVHQLRVAVRRLRAALVLFRSKLEPGSHHQYMVGLRRIAGIFGKARDWDVFVLETLAAAEKGLSQPGRFDLLRKAAEPARTIAHRGLRDEVNGLAFARLVLEIADWIEVGAHTRAPLRNNEADKPITEIVPELLDGVLRKVIKRGRNLHGARSEELHALRKSIKKLRYSIEFFSSLYPKKRVRAYLRPCKELQELLGIINDGTVTIALAEELGQGGGEDLAAAVGTLMKWTTSRSKRARRHVRKSWSALLSADPFWR
ncbi:MAG: CHAD domain-containing protein [Alphaproteobacteria bacterium]|nr:CHAD domain-containing protein [Alphaproteobacteria bacterium]